MKIHGIPWRCLNSFFSTRIGKQVVIWYWYIVQSMLQRMRYEPSQSAIVGIRKNVPSPSVCEIQNVDSLEEIEIGGTDDMNLNFGLVSRFELKSSFHGVQ